MGPELDGRLIGRAHRNSVFDTREYNVEMVDGTIEYRESICTGQR